MIIPRSEYERMQYQIHEARTVIHMKNDMIDSQKEIIYDLIEENKALRSLIGTKDIDFPATEKVHEDKLF